MHTEQIENKKTDILFRQAQGALFATVLGAGIIAWIYVQYSGTRILLPWLVAILSLTAARQYFIHLYNRNPAAVRDKKRWRRRFDTTALLAGCLWGFISVHAVLTQPLQFIAVMILLCGYLIIGASVNYAIFISSFMAFSLPIFTPVIVSLLLRNDVMAQTYSMLLAVFFAYSVISAFRYRSVMTSFITYEISNTSLLEDLRQQQTEASLLNAGLEEDLIKLRKVEEQLRQEKNKAEELAAQLQTISSCDGLTGIANRRSFDEFLAREWNRAIRSQTPLSLILCDIDHFKPYNDYFGHQEGDKCLMRIADILDEHARRGGDLAARYGGEEFTIILPETSLENATEMAEQMRRAIQDAAILHPASDMEKIVTMSFGVATMVPRQGQSSNMLIAIADKALYQAKQEGRNRVIPARPGLLDQSRIEQEG